MHDLALPDLACTSLAWPCLASGQAPPGQAWPGVAWPCRGPAKRGQASPRQGPVCVAIAGLASPGWPSLAWPTWPCHLLNHIKRRHLRGKFKVTWCLQGTLTSAPPPSDNVLTVASDVFGYVEHEICRLRLEHSNEMEHGSACFSGSLSEL